jgi:hypothetical protein
MSTIIINPLAAFLLFVSNSDRSTRVFSNFIFEIYFVFFMLTLWYTRNYPLYWVNLTQDYLIASQELIPSINPMAAGLILAPTVSPTKHKVIKLTCSKDLTGLQCKVKECRNNELVYLG